MSPSMGITCPEIDRAASEARNTASAPMSDGSTNAWRDWFTIPRRSSSSIGRPDARARSWYTRSARSPATAPGAMALTRMSCCPSSIERVFVNPISAHLVDEYGLRLA